MTDPCICDEPCPHGETCGGSHTWPRDHWWPHCDECTPKTANGYLLNDGRTIMVMTRCGHAIGPGPIGEVTRATAEHQRTCTAAKLVLDDWAEKIAIARAAREQGRKMREGKPATFRTYGRR